MLILLCFILICCIPFFIIVIDITDSDIAKYKANKSVYRIKTKKDGKFYPQFKWFIFWFTMYEVGFVRNKKYGYHDYFELHKCEGKMTYDGAMGVIKRYRAFNDIDTYRGYKYIEFDDSFILFDKKYISKKKIKDGKETYLKIYAYNVSENYSKFLNEIEELSKSKTTYFNKNLVAKDEI